MPAIDTKHGKPAKKKARVRKPSSTSIAKAQEQQYASQGAAVKKQAKAQVKVRVRSQQLAKSKHAAGDAPQTRAKDTQRAQSFVKGEYKRQAASDKAKGIVKSPRIKATYTPRTTVPPDIAERVRGRGTTATHKAALAGRVAPVLKVLDQTTRPLHAVAGAANEDVKVIKARGLKHYLVHGAPKAEHAAKRGIQNKDRTTFSDVLKTAGVKNKTVRGVAGFGLDVALDPTSYVLGGTGSVAAREAAKEAARVEAKAAAKGLTADQAKRMGDRAAAQATKKAAGKGSGVTVKLAGQEVPSVRRATAAAGRGTGRATRKVVPRRVREGARSVAADVNPNVTPAGVEKAISQAATRATRRARSESNQGTRAAVDVAHGIRKQIGEKNYAAVVDAIEAQSIKDLPAHLRPHAVTLRSQFRHVRKVQRRAGVKVGEVARRKIRVPTVTADVKGAQEKLSEAVSHRASIERKPKRLTRVPSREEFIANAPKASRDSPTPTVEALTRNVKPGKPGYAIENEHLAYYERGNRDKVVGWGDAFTHSKVIVRRDEKGNVIGALRVALDEHGKPDILEVAVDPAHQGKGLASRLYRYAQQHGLDVESASGRGGYTEAGAGLAHKRLVVRAGRQDKVSAAALRAARGETSRAQATLEASTRQKRAQELARRKALKLKTAQAGMPRGYVPRQLTDTAAEAEGKATSGGVGQRVIKPKSSKARTETRPMKVLREEKPGRYREDLDALVAERLAEGSSSAAKANLNRTLASLGRSIKRGEELKLGEGESVYHVKGSDIRQVTDKDELAKIVRPLRVSKDGTKLKGANKQGGRFVVLPDEVVKRAVEGSTAALQGPGIVHAFDKVTGGFKRLALATPGFHVRNFVGDTSQAYVGGQNPARLAGNMGKAAKVTHELGKQQKATRNLGRPKPSGKTLKTRKYGHVTYEDIAHNLVNAGAARSGYTAGELRELSKSGEKGLRITRPKAPAGVKRAFLNREDIPRLATAIHALQQGATWEEAAQRVADIHFDYQHLTNFERNIARRILPFYTWSARNIPFQAKNIVKRPGKYAAYQKVLEEAGKASQPDQVKQDPKQVETLYTALKQSGVKLPGDWRRYLSEWEQRNAGVPVNLAGGHFTLSAGLPIADLNEFPGAAGKGQFGEYGNRVASLVNPLIKDPVEVWANYSAYFRDQIQRDTGPLVAAPSFVKAWPPAVRKKLGVVKGMDSRSGKTVWKWPGKVDYVSKNMLPGLGNQAQQLMTQGTDRRGRGTAGKVAGVLGLKSVPVDPVTNAVNLAYARQHEINVRLAALRQQVNPGNGRPIGAKNPTQEYQRLSQQFSLLAQVVYAGQSMRGDKKLPTRGGPPKVRGSVSGRGSLGGSGGSLGGSGSLGSGGSLGGAGTLG